MPVNRPNDTLAERTRLMTTTGALAIGLCLAGDFVALPAMAGLSMQVPATPGGTFASGHDDALNSITGQGRSGRSWVLELPGPDQDEASAVMTETIVPAVGRTDIVNIMPSAIVPCVRVIVATDALGNTVYDLAVDAANVNRDFLITDIHTGEPLRFCSGALAARPADDLSAPGSHSKKSGDFNQGHETALNALCGSGRSGRTWSLTDDSGREAMAETVMPALDRTEVVRIMPGAIIPCVRVRVSTDGLGTTTWELAVDAENVNRDFLITDIHTGGALTLCPVRR
ncbi:MAG: hypothetical protein SGI90_08790 [Candidatus Eisenbacteria bacterium]|nr:hypothetical protein [Candidatus Eisenbacteria bacterium]